MTLATREPATILEKVVIEGDLSSLTSKERVEYYAKVCESLGLNPLTKPFAYIRLNNRLVLYASRDATDQLRKLHGVNITKLEPERVEDVYVVRAYATDKEARTDSSIGAVTIGSLKGDALANALMKAETKAKRRVTLSIVGLGWLDEVELETIPAGEKVAVDAETGEVVEAQAEAVKRPQAKQPAPTKLTEDAEQKVYKYGLDNGWQREDILNYIGQQWGLETVRELNLAQITILGDYMKANPKRRPGDILGRPLAEGQKETIL